MIRSTDWVIDLGPEGGAAGGQIIAEGRPEQVAKVAASHTGHFLMDILATLTQEKFQLASLNNSTQFLARNLQDH